MKLYKKEGNVVQVLSFPNETVEKGDYLLVDDSDARKALIVQVIDVQFASIPGVLEELLRSLPDGGELIRGEDFDPLEIAPHITYIQDASLLICKIRATMESENLSPSSSWLPSRSQSAIRKLAIPTLLKLAKVNGKLPIVLGGTKDSSLLTIDALSLDGRLNIITGKKETGKSHLSKLLMLNLIGYKATVFVFDLNGEYLSLGMTSDGKRNASYDKIHVLTPSQNFKVSLKQLNLHVLLGILIHALHLPGTSAREFRRIWQSLKERDMLSMHELGEAIRNWHCNQHVRDALFSRYYALVNSGFFADEIGGTMLLEECLFKAREHGGAIIINLRNTSSIDRQIVVEFVLGKLVELLTSWKLRAVFLFAEEAHLYLRETYWDDIVTRMRHFGIFTTFITNQPDTIRENIYRQADNIFLFNFMNEHDLEVVSRAARVDAETVKSIARDLPPHHCLALGKIVKDFPMVVKVRALDVKTMGETRLFFKEQNS
ncbi:MAG: ATP-binding protein [Candidatus Bathyarchaeota archaeon]|nr:ATP-binding protein [Candidatus Bathyarchaeota archaeon]MDH5787631.1 ATP-binding protein [Candidatus Bathyarchaeota archaeon]